jgi:hypothetical protein
MEGLQGAKRKGKKNFLQAIFGVCGRKTIMEMAQLAEGKTSLPQIAIALNLSLRHVHRHALNFILPNTPIIPARSCEKNILNCAQDCIDRSALRVMFYIFPF